MKLLLLLTATLAMLTHGIAETKETHMETNTVYQFTVKGRGPNGAESTSTIYVIVGNEPGAKPEFTQVVR